MKFVLKCCGKINPIGIDKEHLRLSFETEDNIEILSYEIRIASSEESLTEGKYDIGFFAETQSGNFSVRPEPGLLKERTRYFWCVKANTSDGIQNSDIAYFETGITEWHASWISGYTDDGHVQEFRKTFETKESVKNARLYICGLGYFSARLNGKALDDTYYKPLVTDYEKRIHPENLHLYEASGYRIAYYTYDVTTLIKPGQNELAVEVANGYYCNTDRIAEEPNFSYDEPKLVYELHITETAGYRIIKSDTDTEVRITNKISTLYEGDCIDFTKKPNPFQKSRLAKAPIGKLVSPACEDDKVVDILKVIEARQITDGMLCDFGVNHTGGVRIRIEAEEGAELLIRYAEVLEKDGYPNYETSAWHDKNMYTGQMRDVYQENRYILKQGINEIEPLYSWYCYRYVVIKITGTAKIDKLESLFIRADVKKNGNFECSDETLNRINQMFEQTLLCNMHSGLVTDCPHREKRPYTGDGHITMKSAYYNFEMKEFYYKWFEDLLDAQSPDGLIPHSAPNLGGGGGYAWGNAICFATKYLYQFTGDTVVARKGYDAILKWLRYYASKRDTDYIMRTNSHEWMLGDWLAPEAVSSNVYYINTVCYIMAIDVAIELAEVFDKDRVNSLRGLRIEVQESVNKVFFQEDTLTYGNGVQGENMLALAVGIVPDKYKKSMREKVAHHYSVVTDYHLDTGIVLTPILINYLTDNGYADIAFKIMTAKTYPSYFNLMEDDTTFSEHWSKKWPDYYIGGENSKLVKGGGELSHCHPMYGSVCAWLYERVAGLELTRLGKKEVGIHPHFTDCLTWAKADKIIPYGKVSIDWENGDDGLTLVVCIPQGVSGVCDFPSQYKELRCISTGETLKADEDGFFRFKLQGGKWIFKSKGKESKE